MGSTSENTPVLKKITEWIRNENCRGFSPPSFSWPSNWPISQASCRHCRKTPCKGLNGCYYKRAYVSLCELNKFDIYLTDTEFKTWVNLIYPGTWDVQAYPGTWDLQTFLPATGWDDLPSQPPSSVGDTGSHASGRSQFQTPQWHQSSAPDVSVPDQSHLLAELEAVKQEIKVINELRAQSEAQANAAWWHAQASHQEAAEAKSLAEQLKASEAAAQQSAHDDKMQAIHESSAALELKAELREQELLVEQLQGHGRALQQRVAELRSSAEQPSTASAQREQGNGASREPEVVTSAEKAQSSAPQTQTSACGEQLSFHLGDVVELDKDFNHSVVQIHSICHWPKGFFVKIIDGDDRCVQIAVKLEHVVRVISRGTGGVITDDMWRRIQLKETPKTEAYEVLPGDPEYLNLHGQHVQLVPELGGHCGAVNGVKETSAGWAWEVRYVELHDGEYQVVTKHLQHKQIAKWSHSPIMPSIAEEDDTSDNEGPGWPGHGSLPVKVGVRVRLASVYGYATAQLDTYDAQREAWYALVLRGQNEGSSIRVQASDIVCALRDIPRDSTTHVPGKALYPHIGDHVMLRDGSYGEVLTFDSSTRTWHVLMFDGDSQHTVIKLRHPIDFHKIIGESDQHPPSSRQGRGWEPGDFVRLRPTDQLVERGQDIARIVRPGYTSNTWVIKLLRGEYYGQELTFAASVFSGKCKTVEPEILEREGIVARPPTPETSDQAPPDYQKFDDVETYMAKTKAEELKVDIGAGWTNGQSSAWGQGAAQREPAPVAKWGTTSSGHGVWSCRSDERRSRPEDERSESSAGRNRGAAKRANVQLPKGLTLKVPAIKVEKTHSVVQRIDDWQLFTLRFRTYARSALLQHQGAKVVQLILAEVDETYKRYMKATADERPFVTPAHRLSELNGYVLESLTDDEQEQAYCILSSQVMNWCDSEALKFAEREAERHEREASCLDVLYFCIKNTMPATTDAFKEVILSLSTPTKVVATELEAWLEKYRRRLKLAENHDIVRETDSYSEYINAILHAAKGEGYPSLFRQQLNDHLIAHPISPLRAPKEQFWSLHTRMESLARLRLEENVLKRKPVASSSKAHVAGVIEPVAAVAATTPGGGRQFTPSEHQVIVKNLNPKTSPTELREFLGRDQQVKPTDVRVPLADGQGITNRGFGFADYRSTSEVTTIVRAKNGASCKGAVVEVRPVSGGSTTRARGESSGKGKGKGTRRGKGNSGGTGTRVFHVAVPDGDVETEYVYDEEDLWTDDEMSETEEQSPPETPAAIDDTDMTTTA